MKPHAHVHRTGTLGPLPGEPQPWFSIPEPTPLSPLTCGSDADSEFSPDTESREVEEQEGGEGMEEDGREEEEEEKEEDVQNGEGEENASPNLSELYQRTRGSSPESYLEYSREEQPPPPPQETEDPLWYRPRDSGQFDEVVPMPYETVVKPPPSPQHSAKWIEQELEETDANVLQTLASPRHSGVNYNSLQSPPTSPRGVVPPEQLYRVVGRKPHGTGSPQKQHASFQRPPMSRTVSDNLPYSHSPQEHVTRRASETSNRTEPHSLASTGPSSSLQSHAASSLQQSSLPQGHSKSSDQQSGTMNGSYHSNGPSVEGNLNQVIR